MRHPKRVFILGAGFSKAAGMPLATELLPLLSENLKHEEMREWLDWLRERLAWLRCDEDAGSRSFCMGIEEVFHYAHFDIEVHRLRQHLSTVGRTDGCGTPWNSAESVEAWLSFLEDALRDVILDTDLHSDLTPINRWASGLTGDDAVLTFNYDTLVERALAASKKTWNHGMPLQDRGIPVYKLHGSIDWIVADRKESFSKLDLLFDKQNSNRDGVNTGHVEDDCRLWRCRNREQLQQWIKGRDFQHIPKDASPRTVGIAGLGAYKQLHQVPGLGHVWTRGMRALYQADVAVVVGFQLSDFDAFAQMQFAEVARARLREDRPLAVRVIDPFLNKGAEDRYRRVFRTVEFEKVPHECFDWSSPPIGAASPED